MEAAPLSPNNQLSVENRVVLARELFNLHGDTASNLGHVVIIAGGMGSEKVFATDGPSDYGFEIDALRTAAVRMMVIAKKVKDEFDSDIETLRASSSDQEQLLKLQNIVAQNVGINDEQSRAFFTTVVMSGSDQKTNLIVDVTLQHLRQLDNLCRDAEALGYASDRIHLVWIVTDFDVGQAGHSPCETLAPEILKNIHRGVAMTMNDVCTMGESVRKYIDGDVLIHISGATNGDVETCVLKKSVRNPIPFAEIDRNFRMRIASYVPNGATWE